MAGAFAPWHVCCPSVPQRSCKNSKKAPQRPHVNSAAIQPIDAGEISVEIQPVEEADVDEMWSVVGKKAHQRWLWPASDHLHDIVIGLFVNRDAFGMLV
jgi:hypothetical protein